MIKLNNFIKKEYETAERSSKEARLQVCLFSCGNDPEMGINDGLGGVEEHDAVHRRHHVLDHRSQIAIFHKCKQQHFQKFFALISWTACGFVVLLYKVFFQVNMDRHYGFFIVTIAGSFYNAPSKNLPSFCLIFRVGKERIIRWQNPKTVGISGLSRFVVIIP